MNIALIGYGKMGHAIEQVAIQRGHSIVLRITSANRQELDAIHLQAVDVAIEFTSPEAAKNNVLECLSTGVSVISGTTGWNDGIPEAQAMAKKQKSAFLHASNFSIGVNIFFEVNKLLASLMDGRKEYNIIIEETHHTRKKDAPSGTAITLAEQIIQNLEGKRNWILNNLDEAGSIPIISHRLENVPGTHRVSYSSPVDDIEIIHTAHNRDGFALGAVLAAEYIKGREGVFSMKDVLGIK
ncbi:MAG: 4-hydroxy-tetrahydrodipicolinate reductase [Chitinophagales bacterium]